MLIKLILLFFAYFIMLNKAQPSCHILCNCNLTNQCQSCYNNFQSSSSLTSSVNGSCSCPQYFYKNFNDCLFCMQNCKICTDGLTCIECQKAYTYINGSCIKSIYQNQSTWFNYLIASDFNYNSDGAPNIFGYTFLPNDPNVIISNTTCSSISNKSIITLRSNGNQSLTVIRTYFGIPFHQWAHLTIKYIVIDIWEGQQIQFDLYMFANLAKRSYNNSLRSKNLCGESAPDSIDILSSYFSHNDTKLALSINIPANRTLSLYSVQLDVGTCPRNCLQCSNPNSCLICKQPYYADANGTCQCNISTGYNVSYGCIYKCKEEYIFIVELQRCVLCGIYIDFCFSCGNQTVCLSCNQNTYLHYGKCLTKCPAGYFPKKTSDSDSNVPHCHPCPLNCLSCLNQLTCILCQSLISQNTNFFLSQGSCISTCPNNTVSYFKVCYTVVPGCSIGCGNCNNTNICIECQLGFWLTSDNICVTNCTGATYQHADKKCYNCPIGCMQCIDVYLCLACQNQFVLLNGTCQTYYEACTHLGHYFDKIIKSCVACPQSCLSCYRTLCYSCINGYYLDNGACLQTCSQQKQNILGNGVVNNICWWRSQLCQIDNTQANKCSRCRSQYYPLSLNLQNLQCETTCQNTYTISVQSIIITDNYRVCNVSCPSNCKICLSSMKCIKCENGYMISMINSQCVSNCQAGYLSDSFQCQHCPYQCNTCDIVGKCISWAISPNNILCPTNCSNCIGLVCVRCQPNYYLNPINQECLNSCPSTTFPDDLSQQCRKCLPECMQCQSFVICTKCIQTFYLNEFSCAQKCPIGKYPNPENGVCSLCSTNCRTCYGPSHYHCLSCYLNNSKDYSTCLNNTDYRNHSNNKCPVNKYTDDQGSCDWCHQICRFCYGPAQFQCLQCNNGSYLYQSECYPQGCPSGTYISILPTRQCKKCSRACLTCLNLTKCRQCATDYYLANGSCIQNCAATTYYSFVNNSCLQCQVQCSICQSPTFCLKCSANFSLFNNTCISGCPNGTFIINYNSRFECIPCPQGCTSCKSLYKCTNCMTDMILRNGVCTNLCDIIGKYYDNVTKICRTCSPGCIRCNNWGCLECGIGYYQFNNTCVYSCPASTYMPADVGNPICQPCPFSCLSCLSFQQCTQCKKNYTLNIKNGVCTNNNNCSFGCETCADSKNCVICNIGFKRFVNSNGTYCVSLCSIGLFDYGGIQCKPCQQGCMICSSPKICQRCQPDLILFKSECLQGCYPGYYYVKINSTKYCQPCDPICQTCIQSSKSCTLCSSPSAIAVNLTCIQKRQCKISTFYFQPVKYCMPCISNCKICHNPQECDQCLTNCVRTIDKRCIIGLCEKGTYKQRSINNIDASQCYPCQFPCISCNSASQCNECASGYPLNTTSLKCQMNCNFQTSYYHNEESNTCQKCQKNCLSCTKNSQFCLQCKKSYYLIENTCTKVCPDTTFPAENIRLCLSCSQYCITCVNQQNCINCQFNTYLFYGICLISCPQGYFKNSGHCLPCVEPCRQCKSGSIYQCSSCVQRYYFYKNRCILNCPNGYYQNIQTSSCRECPLSCQTCLSYYKCLSCKSGYIYSSLTLQCETYPICSQTMATCSTCIISPITFMLECSSCFFNYYLYQGQCVQQCPPGFYQDKHTGNCEACSMNCTVCGDINMCSDCDPGFFIVNGQCFSTCPAGMSNYTQILNELNVDSCKIDPCVRYNKFNQNNSCVLCVRPYLLLNGSCVYKQNCIIGTFSSQLSCLLCTAGCIQCSNATYCKKCDLQYHLYSSSCLEQCPSGTYSYILSSSSQYQFNQCVPCAFNCLLCQNSTVCHRCLQGYFLTQNTQCKITCSRGYYPNININSCVRCATNCLYCISYDVCQYCDTNMSYFYAGLCVANCPDGTYPAISKQCLVCQQNCKSCDINATCTICHFGYYLNKLTNQCILQCPSGTYPTMQKQCYACLSPCSTCLSASRCLSCLNSSLLPYFHQGKCISECPSTHTSTQILIPHMQKVCIRCNPLCKQCSIVADNCTQCLPSYSLINGYCRNNCPANLFLNSSNQCESCNFNRNSAAFKCSQCYGQASNQCVLCSFSYYLLFGKCFDRCPQGYYASQDDIIIQCKVCSQNCLQCQGTRSNCTKCYPSYYLVNEKCQIACPKTMYANNNDACVSCAFPCQQCLSQLICLSCKFGYYFTPQQTCSTNCTFFVNQNSLQVKSYFMNQLTKKCHECSSHCSSCTLQTNCLQCLPSYYLYNSACIFQCPSMTYASSFTCELCSQTYCIQCKSGTECTACEPASALLFNGDCVKDCPSGYSNVNSQCILEYISVNNCTQGYLFNSTILTLGIFTQCRQYCPFGYFVSSTQCLKCPDACLSCKNLTYCQVCRENFRLFNGSCTTICPISTIQLNITCFSCPINCLSCSPSSIQCTSCLSPYSLLNSQCLSACPDGYYSSTSNISKQCQICPLKCSKCSNSITCTACKNRRYSPPTCTDSTCILSKYKQQSAGVCTPCNNNCATCISGSFYSCTACNSPFILVTPDNNYGQCRIQCPNGTTISINTNTCINCNQGCNNCTYISNILSCILCFESLILHENQCLKDCSSLQTEIQKYTTDGTVCLKCPMSCLQCIIQDATLGTTSCVTCQYDYILIQEQCMSSCPQKYYQFSKKCLKCKENCLICSSPINCTSCQTNTYLYDNSCVQQCPTNLYKNDTLNRCQNCIDQRCQQCRNEGNNICDICLLPNYVNIYNKNCDNCTNGYLWNSGKKICQRCSDLSCTTCSGTLNNCISCTIGRLLLNNKCIQSCPATYYQPLPQVNPRACLSCPLNCTSCNPFNSTQCLSCVFGYYYKILTYQCLPQCPTNTYIANFNDCHQCPIQCLACTDQRRCTKCVAGYYLWNNQCLSKCPPQSYINETSLTCIKCLKGCIQCPNFPLNCTRCRSDHFLNTTSSQCHKIPTCPQSQYPQTDGLCYSCANTCRICNSLNQCTQCIETLYLTHGICANECFIQEYFIVVNIGSMVSKVCIGCPATCDLCNSSIVCTHCRPGYYLNPSNMCISDCGYQYYQNQIINTSTNTTDYMCTACMDRNCKICTKYGCLQCLSQYYRFGFIKQNSTNGTCKSQCPSSFFKDNTATPLQCVKCSINRCDQCTADLCIKCIAPYYLFVSGNISSCLSSCPNNLIPVTNNNITKCETCVTGCLTCKSEQWCTKCDIGFYLLVLNTYNITVNISTNSSANVITNSTINITNYNTTCLKKCPQAYYQYRDVLTTNNSTCNKCQSNCLTCVNQTFCTVCQQPSYVLFNADCIPQRCQNCQNCQPTTAATQTLQVCLECNYPYFLFVQNGQCYTKCQDGYYGDKQTKQCIKCMDLCSICINDTTCEQCNKGYNFTGSQCVTQGFMKFGSLSNMSGYTANITSTMQWIYIGTSVGSLLFGNILNTYFSIEFCQFILFHSRVLGKNSQIEKFLDSLQLISLTMSSNTSQEQARRFLTSNSSLRNPPPLIQKCAPLFILIAIYLIIYICIKIFQKYSQNCCSFPNRPDCCSKTKLIIKQICAYLSKRYQWIYIDFLVWVSYIPFVYFSLIQLQEFSFKTALDGISCILSMMIVMMYLVYPFFIIYKIAKNYKDIKQKNNQQIQNSLYPFIAQIKRLKKKQIPMIQNQQQQQIKQKENNQQQEQLQPTSIASAFKEIKFQNIRLIYIPLKYVRKFIFVMVVIFWQTQKTSIIALISINCVLIGYMLVFRPKIMPYMMIDFVIEFLMLSFQVFVYFYIQSDVPTEKITGISIVIHVFGFITTNISILIAITLNLIIYYQIICCAKDLYCRVKRKLQGIKDLELGQQIQKESEKYQKKTSNRIVAFISKQQLKENIEQNTSSPLRHYVQMEQNLQKVQEQDSPSSSPEKNHRKFIFKETYNNEKQIQMKNFGNRENQKLKRNGQLNNDYNNKYGIQKYIYKESSQIMAQHEQNNQVIKIKPLNIDDFITQMEKEANQSEDKIQNYMRNQTKEEKMNDNINLLRNPPLPRYKRKKKNIFIEEQFENQGKKQSRQQKQKKPKERRKSAVLEINIIDDGNIQKIEL